MTCFHARLFDSPHRTPGVYTQLNCNDKLELWKLPTDLPIFHCTVETAFWGATTFCRKRMITLKNYTLKN